MVREEEGVDVVGGEIMNQRTAVPMIAASTAVISPNPPGGDITTRVLVVLLEVGFEVDWRGVVWWYEWFILIDDVVDVDGMNASVVDG